VSRDENGNIPCRDVLGADDDQAGIGLNQCCLLGLPVADILVTADGDPASFANVP